MNDERRGANDDDRAAEQQPSIPAHAQRMDRKDISPYDAHAASTVVTPGNALTVPPNGAIPPGPQSPQPPRRPRWPWVAVTIVIVLLLAIIGFLVVERQLTPMSHPSGTPSVPAPTTTSPASSSSTPPPVATVRSATAGSTTATLSESSGASPIGVSSTKLLKELPEPGASGNQFTWQNVDLAGKPAEGETAYLSPCGASATAIAHFFVTPGYNYFVADIGTTANSHTGSKVRFEVILNNGNTSLPAPQGIVVDMLQPKTLEIPLDGTRNTDLMIKSTLVEPPATACTGASTRAVWSGARVEARQNSQ